MNHLYCKKLPRESAPTRHYSGQTRTSFAKPGKYNSRKSYHKRRDREEVRGVKEKTSEAF